MQKLEKYYFSESIFETMPNHSSWEDYRAEEVFSQMKFDIISTRVECLDRGFLALEKKTSMDRVIKYSPLKAQWRY